MTLDSCGILSIKNSPYSLESILNRALFFCSKTGARPFQIKSGHSTGTTVPIVTIVCVAHTAICSQKKISYIQFYFVTQLMFQTQCGSRCLVYAPKASKLFAEVC